MGPDERAAALIQIAEAEDENDMSPLRRAEMVCKQFSAASTRIPARLLEGLSMSEFVETEAMGVSRKWRTFTSGTLILYGPTGSGKSLAAARWCFERQGHWLSAPRFAMDGFPQAAQTLRQRSRGPLVVDDVGAEGTTSDVGTERIIALLNDRTAHAQVTVITTNLGPVHLKRALRQRWADRMEEDGEFHRCNQDSLRGKAKPAGYNWVKRAHAVVRGYTAARRIVDGKASPFASSDEMQRFQQDMRATDDQVERAREACKENARSMIKLRDYTRALAAGSRPENPFGKAGGDAG